MIELADKKVIACNYLEATKIASKGALCYVVSTSGAAERVNVLVRSRSGRWIKKWESFKRLGNFRTKTLPPTHPRYGDARLVDYSQVDGWAERDLDWFRQIKGTQAQ